MKDKNIFLMTRMRNVTTLKKKKVPFYVPFQALQDVVVGGGASGKGDLGLPLRGN